MAFQKKIKIRKVIFNFEWLMDLINTFTEYISKDHLVQKKDKILLAVSGGVDSVVLLDLFLRIRFLFGLTLAVVHVNHGLRGEAADCDEVFIRNRIRHFGLPFYSLKIDVKMYSEMKKLSIEESGRQIRFGFFDSLFHRLRYDKVALAHHANDQAETIIMHLTRGSGIRGMGGMHPMRTSIIRPLLFATKKEIKTYAHEQRLEYREDVTNRDKVFLRNRIRLDIIKKMEEVIGSHVVHTISRTGTVMRETDALITFEAQKAIKKVLISRSQNEIILDIDKFLSYFRIIQKTILIQILETINNQNQSFCSLEIDRILHLIEKGRNGAVIQLEDGLRTIKNNRRLIFIKKLPEIKKVKICMNQYYELPEIHVRFHSELLKKNIIQKDFSNDGWTGYIDYDKIIFPLILRSWIHGDWFIPLGMQGKKKLHDFFIDAKVPHYKRSSVPLLTGGQDILWVAGYRIDDRFKVTDQTKNILKLTVTHI